MTHRDDVSGARPDHGDDDGDDDGDGVGVHLRVAHAHADALARESDAAAPGAPDVRERAVAAVLASDTGGAERDTDPRPVLDALDRARSDLAHRAAQVERRVEAEPSIPPDVLARVDRAIAAERAGAAGRTERTPTDRPGPAAGPRRRRRRVPLALAALAAAAVTVVVVAVPTATIEPPVAGPDVSTGPGGSPGAGNTRPAVSRGDSVAALQAGLGRADYGPLADPARLRECLGAHGLDARTVPVGGREVVVDGRAAVVLVLTTGTAARFRVLVVEPGCSAGAPLGIADDVVGR